MPSHSAALHALRFSMLAFFATACSSSGDGDGAAASDAEVADDGADVADGEAAVADDGGVDAEAGPPSCPSAPPVDFSNADLAARCGQMLYVAGGNRSLRITSNDLVAWENPHVDQTNCLSNMDGTVNCGKSSTFDCSHEDVSSCKPLFDGLDCSRTSSADGKTIECGGFDDGAFGVAFGLGRVVVSSDFGIYTSEDRGVTWKKAGAPAPQQWGQGGHVSAAVFGNGRFLVLGDDVTFTSTDGLEWKKSTFSVPGGGTGYWGFHGVAYGNGHFVAIGTQRVGGVDTPMVKVTEDGVTYHDVQTNSELQNVVFDGTRFVAVGNKGLRATSSDGVTWTKLAADDPGCTDPATWTGPKEKCLGKLSMIASGNDSFYVCGDNCAISKDKGVTWSRTSAWTYRGVYFARGRFYEGGTLRWTTDGTAWKTDPGAAFPAGVAAIGIERVAGGLVLAAK